MLFHFGGILTAVFSVPPPNSVACWMTSALWTYVYRPYLQFMYLNNAYHFYSPEPGAATQPWFCVRYEDPKLPPLWVQVPRREDYPSRLLYQRATAMTESTTYARGYPDDIRERVLRRARKREEIPYHPELQTDKTSWAADLSQYREPNEVTSKKYVASYARHVARDLKYRSPDSPDTPVKTVKVYRVLHTLLSAKEMGEDLSPEEPSKLLPVYMGEFDPDGHLTDPGDPLLYWVVPILRVPDERGKFVVKDYVAVHAGEPPCHGEVAYESPRRPTIGRTPPLRHSPRRRGGSGRCEHKREAASRHGFAGFVGDVNRFFFQPSDTATLGLIRLCAGFLIL